VASSADEGFGGAVRRLIIAAGVTTAVVAIDAATKAWARTLSHSIHVIGSLSFVRASNTGAAFSLFQGGSGWLSVVSLTLCVVLGVGIWRTTSMAMTVALSLILGGALGNGIERVVTPGSGVTDFIATSIWPVFNVADACITVGCLWIALQLIRTKSPHGE